MSLAHEKGQCSTAVRTLGNSGQMTELVSDWDQLINWVVRTDGL